MITKIVLGKSLIFILIHLVLTSCMELTNTKVITDSKEQDVGSEKEADPESLAKKSCVAKSQQSFPCSITNAKIANILMKCNDSGSGFVVSRECQVSVCKDGFEISGNSCDVVVLPTTDYPIPPVLDTLGLLFEDTFESGNMSKTNSGGFHWTDMNRTSLVYGDGVINKQIWTPRGVSDVHISDGRDWSALSGTNSLRFRYAANESMAEQRFSINEKDELWFRYWVRVPNNFRHGSASPSNNKFFALWMDGYSNKGNGSSIAWEFWNDGHGGSNLAFHYSKEGFEIMGGHNQSVPFISYPSDQGRWMQIVIHTKAATSISSNDGVIELYRRWKNESEFTRLHHTNSADIGKPTNVPGFKAGYLMGWSNPTYAENTEWLIDDFQISSTSLVNDEVVTTPPVVDPNPPEVDELGLLFSDTFESGDMSTTNDDGFSWGGNNRTSIVFSDENINKQIWNNGITDILISDGRDWSPKNGTNSLRFRYSAGTAMAEQRFDLGTPQKEVWYSYWTRVPENYYHTTSGGAVNNKFFSMWTDGYSQAGVGSTFWLSMESSGSGNSNLAFTYSLGGNTSSLGMQQPTPFIDYQRDRNRWMKIVIHLKTESSENANDGVVETWRRWSDEDTFTKFHEKFDAPLRIPPGGPQGFKTGYLFGWANGAYTENTEWLLDDFKVSTTYFLDNDPIKDDNSTSGRLGPSSSANLYFDSFENGNMSISPVLNNINFNWEGNNKTSVVTMDQTGPLAIYSSGPVMIRPSIAKDWTAKDGENSLRFRFPEGDHMAEQRFNFNTQRELWIRYWTRVPINYYHGGQNNKFFALWEDAYGELELNLRWQTRPSGNGGAVLNIQDGGATGEAHPVAFVSVPEDRGRWMQVVIHVKTATSATATNGIVQFYRRWENESDFTILHDIQTSKNQWNGASAGWSHGYFMGWANGAYNAETEWLVDKVEFSSDSLL